MPLKLQYASDLHLEFPSNKVFIQNNPLQPAGEILVLAGDIVPFMIMEKHRDFFSYVADHFATTYWLPGNHEYYHFDISEKCGALNEKIRSNVFLVNNTSVVHDHVRLIFSTLWSKISPGNQWHIERSLNDFHLIKQKGFRLSSEPYNRLHEESLAYIQGVMKLTNDEKVVVFTHHCPTFLNYPEQYKGDVLNEAFAVELYELIERSGLTYWGYGHHHSNTPNFCIGDTILTTNQLGYVQRGEHLQFEPTKCINI